MPIKSFHDLIVWKKSMTLACDVYRLTVTFPNDERFGLTSQMRRAAVSVPSNIAEGHGRITRGEYLNAISVARGSANEVETLLLISQRLGLVEPKVVEPLISEVDQVRRMLSRLRTRLHEGRRGSQS